MNKRFVLSAIVLTMIIGGANPLSAHHSWAAEFDLTNPTHIQGTVVKVDWANPHVRFTIRGRDRAGAIIDLRVEGSTTVTILSTQRVLKSPACWFIPNDTTTLADVENMNAHCPIPEVP